MTVAQVYILAEVEQQAGQRAQEPAQSKGTELDVAMLSRMTLTG